MAKQHGLTKVYVHCFLDGRDVPPTSGLGYVEELEAKMKEIGAGKIATVMGRYWAMDRDNRWERVEKAYDAIVLGEGVTAAQRGAGRAAELRFDKGETTSSCCPPWCWKTACPPPSSSRRTA